MDGVANGEALMACTSTLYARCSLCNSHVSTNCRICGPKCARPSREGADNRALVDAFCGPQDFRACCTDQSACGLLRQLA
jgi:hypothetical protein